MPPDKLSTPFPGLVHLLHQGAQRRAWTVGHAQLRGEPDLVTACAQAIVELPVLSAVHRLVEATDGDQRILAKNPEKHGFGLGRRRLCEMESSAAQSQSRGVCGGHRFLERSRTLRVHNTT